MNPQLQALKNWFDSNKSLIQGAAAPILVVAILAMMVLPMPPWLLDTFFTLNIANLIHHLLYELKNLHRSWNTY